MSDARDAIDVVVLISGEGSNLQAIIDASESGRIAVRVVTVISNRKDAPGLQRAARHGIPTRVIERREHAGRAAFDRALLAAVRALKPDLVVLAGFMHILDDAFVEACHGRLLNVHPSLLPEYPGLDTHRRVLSAGGRMHGCSIHFVTGELDGGPVIAQYRVPVLDDDDVDRLSARVQVAEHKLYPEVIGWFAGGRLELAGDRISLDGRPLEKPVDLGAMEEAI